MRIHDNSTLSEAKRCLRKHYFRHELGWRPAEPEMALVFGEAWHSAMDVMWKMCCGASRINNSAVIEASFAAFNKVWGDNALPALGDASPDQLEDMGARSPATALEMLHAYLHKRSEFLLSSELLHIEQPFAVPIDLEGKIFYAGKLDKVIRHDGDVIIIDHKTTTLSSGTQKDRNYGIRASYLESFSPNSQFDGYAFAGHMLYKAKAVWADIALVHKNAHDVFKWVIVERQFAALDSWLWGTHYWIDAVERNREAAASPEADSSPYLPAFPMNTSACFDFNRNCPYLDLCRGYPNPKNKPLPPGFIQEFWSPFAENQLQRIGMIEAEK